MKIVSIILKLQNASFYLNQILKNGSVHIIHYSFRYFFSVDLCYQNQMLRSQSVIYDFLSIYQILGRVIITQLNVRIKTPDT